uniref:BI1-like protein n=1 Tax=Populus alba TaxID=43335 RepID=A0A4U5Q0H4_POPAL|nr:hypothetical protein D5086_0000154850 [Populus alba]
MWNQARTGNELGGRSKGRYPNVESPQLRWAFIRKVYSILLSVTFNNRKWQRRCFSLLPLYYYHQKHPVNYILLGIFTICLAFAVGLLVAYTELSVHPVQFWAARRGHDFNFLGPFLFGAIMVLIVFSLIQILFPLGRISVMIYGCLASIIFCGYIIYDTDNLIKRHTYDEYIWAAVSLYLDIINLFLSLLTIFRAADT